jgi:phenylacetate-coenzyme A ligase PaaK-like adenylate-forming protein
MQVHDENFNSNVFKIKTPSDFEGFALQIFQFQSIQNKVYRDYLNALKIDTSSIKTADEIPHLPIEFFKTHQIKSFEGTPEATFTSSGTTGESSSRHHVKKLKLYEESFMRGFDLFYGNPSQYCILALLPSYMEREGSSLIYMTKKLIESTGHIHSGFYLNNLEELSRKLNNLEDEKQNTLLLGVSFALLDLAEKYPQQLHHTSIMETGGMKGRRRELTREELHGKLKAAFGVKNIHSEYGMTELLSQAYSKGEGIYFSPPWMKISIRDIYDPFSPVETGKTGGINITDLANIHSCSFIQTSDLGKLNPDGSFEVIGRMDSSDLRGCNLMVE